MRIAVDLGTGERAELDRRADRDGDEQIEGQQRGKHDGGVILCVPGGSELIRVAQPPGGGSAGKGGMVAKFAYRPPPWP